MRLGLATAWNGAPYEKRCRRDKKRRCRRSSPTSRCCTNANRGPFTRCANDHAWSGPTPVSLRRTRGAIRGAQGAAATAPRPARLATVTREFPLTYAARVTDKDRVKRHSIDTSRGLTSRDASFSGCEHAPESREVSARARPRPHASDADEVTPRDYGRHERWPRSAVPLRSPAGHRGHQVRPPADQPMIRIGINLR